jgi:hypothetical protein
MARHIAIPPDRISSALSARELLCLSVLRKAPRKSGMTRVMRLRFLMHRCIELRGKVFALTPRGRTALLIGRLQSEPRRPARGR